jgi:hypothetical protein
MPPKKKMLRTIVELAAERTRTPFWGGSDVTVTPKTARNVGRKMERKIKRSSERGDPEYVISKDLGIKVTVTRPGKRKTVFTGSYDHRRKSIWMHDLNRKAKIPEHSLPGFTVGELRQAISHVKKAVPGAKRVLAKDPQRSRPIVKIVVPEPHYRDYYGKRYRHKDININLERPAIKRRKQPTIFRRKIQKKSGWTEKRRGDKTPPEETADEVLDYPMRDID